MTRGGQPQATQLDVAASTRPIKRSFRIRGHSTSISLEQAFWDVLQDAGRAHDLTPAELVARIDTDRGNTNLSSAVRVFLLQYALAHRRSNPSD